MLIDFLFGCKGRVRRRIFRATARVGLLGDRTPRLIAAADGIAAQIFRLHLREIVATYYLMLPPHTYSMTIGEEVGNILEAITMIESKIQSDGPDSGVNTAMQLRFEVVCEHWVNVKQFCERLILNYEPNAEEDSDDDEVAGSAASPPGDGPPGDGPPGDSPPGDGPPKKKSAVQPRKRVRR